MLSRIAWRTVRGIEYCNDRRLIDMVVTPGTCEIEKLKDKDGPKIDASGCEDFNDGTRPRLTKERVNDHTEQKR